MTLPAPKSTHVPPVVTFGVFAVVALVALIAMFGFPLLILLADAGAMVGLALIVGLTALDLKGSAKPRPARRARSEATAQAA